MAPPGVAPGTSTVSACAHKEHKDARALPQAERMSGATWQSCPLHRGRDPTPTKPKRHEHVSPVLSPSVVSVHLHEARTANALAKRTKRHGKRAKIGQKERGARASRARANRIRGPPGTKTGLSFRVRTLRLCPCVVMRGLHCVPRSKIRVASCIIPISVLSFWRDAYGVTWHTGSVVQRIAALA